MTQDQNQTSPEAQAIKDAQAIKAQAIKDAQSKARGVSKATTASKPASKASKPAQRPDRVSPTSKAGVPLRCQWMTGIKQCQNPAHMPTGKGQVTCTTHSKSYARGKMPSKWAPLKATLNQSLWTGEKASEA